MKNLILSAIVASGIFSSCSSTQSSRLDKYAGLPKSFDNADKDNSDYLSVDEYGGMIRKNTIRHMAHSELTGSALQEKMVEVETSKFNRTDTNDDNKVTFEEHLISRIEAAQRKAAKRAAEAAK